MKRRIFLLAAVLSAAILFTGCSTQNSDSGSKRIADQNSESMNGEEWELQYDTETLGISREEAARIVLSRVEGAEESDIQELKTDYDDGQFVYEGELRSGGYEYEFEIDGSTGEIIQWEIDRN